VPPALPRVASRCAPFYHPWPSTVNSAGELVSQIARESRAKLVASLAARTSDIASAEDAVAEAFRAALEYWPVKGIPQNPAGWLFTVATRRLTDQFRKTSHETELTGDYADATTESPENYLNDERLQLFFVCAHPGIDENVRAALMLQTILGLDAERIASAYLVSPAAMAKRLVRAKNKIRISKIPFVIPEAHELAARTTAVLDAIYGAYGLGHDDIDGGTTAHIGLADEAIYLVRTLTEILPHSAEVLGLLALMLFSAARAPSRRNADGDYIPLQNQDPKLWRVNFIFEADAALKRAAAMHSIGPFQLEAAIQAVHTARGVTGKTDWGAICELYAGLIELQPTVGAQVACAAALLQKGDIPLARTMLDQVSAVAQSYQPFWAVTAELLIAEKKTQEAHASFRRAAALANDAAARAYLLRRLPVSL
jgi:RNA polymerase sigma-70 factor (ECF subfamily)